MIKRFNDNPTQKNIDVAINELSNNKNNCIAHIYKDEIVKTNGLLAGVPITIKNIFATNDASTDASCKLLHNFYPGYDATVVSLLKENGASIVAKVNLDELALGGTGLLSSYGIIKNPKDPGRMVGGSSSGSAATLSNNICAAIASDTGDSIRIPASYNGIVGFKPSYGAISRRGMFPYASSLDTVSYFTHNVYDSAILSSILFKKDLKDSTSTKVEFDINNIILKKPKIVHYLYFDDISEEYVKKSFFNLINKLKANNINVKRIYIDKKIMKALPIVYKIISFSEVASNDSNLSGMLFGNTINSGGWSNMMLKTRKEGFGELATARMILGSIFLSGENQILYLEKAQKTRYIIAKLYSKILSECDILIYPTCGNIAPKITDNLNNISRIITTRRKSSDILLASNFLGSPSISIPLDRYNKMPYGLNIDTSIYNDHKLLSYTLYLEKLIGYDNE